MTQNVHRLLPLAILAFAQSDQLRAQTHKDSTVFLSYSANFLVRDVRRSAAFYRDTLGLPFVKYLIYPGRAQERTTLQPSDPEPYVAVFKVGGQSLDLDLADGPVQASGSNYYFEVSDPAAYLVRLKSRGVRVQWILGDSTSASYFAVVDPDGRRLVFSTGRPEH